MINLEIKVAVDDLEAVERSVRAAGAHYAGRLEQDDTFYAVPTGLLKLRIIRSAATTSSELIAYRRAAVTGSKVSDYSVYPVSDPAALDAVLSRSLTKIGMVRKRRDLWLFGGTRIHLDSVDGLGTFVELETEGNTRDQAATRDEHAKVIAALELDVSRSLAVSYAEVLFGSEVSKSCLVQAPLAGLIHNQET